MLAQFPVFGDCQTQGIIDCGTDLRGIQCELTRQCPQFSFLKVLIQELLGKLVMYRTAAEAAELRGGIPEFRILSEEEETKEFLQNALKHV